MKLSIITPVLNDWASCHILLGKIDALALPGVSSLRVLIVNDGSAIPVPDGFCAHIGSGRINHVSIVQLACNVGHQRAIALGIAVVARDDCDECVLVMDADGEDDPAAIPKLLEALRQSPQAIVVAGRAKRSEGMRFRLGYWAYQSLFRALVGRRIDFGNFSVFGPDLVQRLAAMPETWNHLAATLLRARVELVNVPTIRAVRYVGRSTMNLPSLIAHGLSAFAVFSDYVFSRLLLFACGLGGTAFFGTLIVLLARLFTELAIPGWASTFIGIFALLFVQAILICLVAALQMLATRSQPGAQPAALVGLYVRGVDSLALGQS